MDKVEFKVGQEVTLLDTDRITEKFRGKSGKITELPHGTKTQYKADFGGTVIFISPEDVNTKSKPESNPTKK